jgi:hypothetical protein
MTYTNDTGAPICVNADKSTVVDCASAEAAFLLVGPEGELPDEVAAQYGLDKQRGRPAEKADAPAEDKAAEKPADKAAPRK